MSEMFKDGAGMPPHFLGPPLQQLPGMGRGPIGGFPPGLAMLAGLMARGPNLRVPPGSSRDRDGDGLPDPARAAAMVEMGKYFQARGKEMEAQRKTHEARGSLRAAMQTHRAGQGRY